MSEIDKKEPSVGGGFGMAFENTKDVIGALEMMAHDVKYIESFPVGRWLVRQEQEDPEWVKAWQGIYREALIAAINILKDRAL